MELIVLTVFFCAVQAMKAESNESWSFESNLVVGTRDAAEIYLHERICTPEIWEKAFRYFFALVCARQNPLWKLGHRR